MFKTFRTTLGSEAKRDGRKKFREARNEEKMKKTPEKLKSVSWWLIANEKFSGTWEMRENKQRNYLFIKSKIFFEREARRLEWVCT